MGKRKALPPLRLTDRMREQGVPSTCWQVKAPCPQCGGPQATNGITVWCCRGTHD